MQGGGSNRSWGRKFGVGVDIYLEEEETQMCRVEGLIEVGGGSKV